MSIRICTFPAVHPVLWRFVGFVSSLVGFICYAMSPPFNKLFEYGELGFLVITIYCALISLVCCTMLCTTTWGLTKSTRWKTHAAFFILMVTSVYSFFQDKSEEGKGEKESEKVLNLISCGAFSLMSLSLSRLTALGFEVGMFNFFLGGVMISVMKMNVKFTLAVVVFCYILFSIRTYSDSELETIHSSDGEEAEHALIENGSLESNEHYRPRPIPLALRPEVIYDVCISFNGKDTSDIPEYLACALLRKSLRIYAHEELTGGEIPPTVVREIERSMVSVVILSKSYLDTAWCFEELHNIMLCRARYARIVIPIFYNIDRTTVGKYWDNYVRIKDGVSKHYAHNVKKWCNALTEAAILQGWEMLDHRRPYELLEDVANHVLSHCTRNLSSE